jgi:uncharacterized membrane protein (DUF4010 family)
VAVLWLPTLLGGLAAAAWGWWLLQGAPAELAGGVGSSPRIEGLPGDSDARMFSLPGAAAVVVLLSAIQALVHGLDVWLGEAGLIAGTMIASLADLHAAMAAVFASSGASLSPGDALPVMLALAVHAGSKSMTAGLVGGRRYLMWLAPGLWAHTLLIIGLLFWAM